MLAKQLIATIQSPISIHGDVETECTYFSTFEESSDGAVTYLTSSKFEKLKTHSNLFRMSLLIVDFSLIKSLDRAVNIQAACVVFVDDSRKIFAMLLNDVEPDSPILVRNTESKISPEAIIHPKAIIEQGVTIERGSYIAAGAAIKSNTFIGESVYVGENSVIGKDGFGFITLDDGLQYRFRHVGGVRVGNNVEVGALSVIDKGTLSFTQIGDGVKIDNLVHIAHNVSIGSNTLVIASATICGSVAIGKNCRIAPGAVIREGLRIGDGAIIGLGSVVLKDVAPKTIVVGNPARYLRDI